MPYAIDANTPRKGYEFAKVAVSVPAPFAEGQVLTSATASVLNQVYAENLRNNLAEKIKAEPHTAQALVDQLVSTYEFGVRTGGGKVSDPVERRAMQMAIETIKAALVKKGIKLNGEGVAGKIRDKATSMVADNPKWKTQAARALAAEAKIAEEGLDLEGLELGGDTTTSQEQAAA